MRKQGHAAEVILDKSWNYLRGQMSVYDFPEWIPPNMKKYLKEYNKRKVKNVK